MNAGRGATIILLAAALCASTSCRRCEEARREEARGRGEALKAALGAATRSAPPPSAATRPAATRPTTATAPSRPAMRRVHVFISGRVQGVGFRAFTQRGARALKVAGWVRNRRDGRVEAVFEGPPEQVARLLAKVAVGPGPARVDDVKVTDEPWRGEFETFDRRPTE